ncbi:protein-domain-containing protein [Kickxella alabastrina]|uniref:protein-domain-containing protein n=1 Tax=Kickxella alabastrina TaxID=61397 RepID=UPI00221F615F|nr:protein-domain-containing protein [Kickxella alabastrina]KAI7833981.1 protein-domain-containing protein [Kickxella alabastrina]
MADLLQHLSSGTDGLGSSAGNASSPLPPMPQLFQLDTIDIVDGWQQELVECYHALAAMTAGKSQMEVHDALQHKASESMRGHGELVNGLVYGILTEPADGAMFFRQLSIVSRDGFAHAVSRLQLLVSAHKFSRLRTDVKQQLFWMIGELARAKAGGTDQVVMQLTRQLRGGDVSQPNVNLCRQVLKLLETHYEWLMGSPTLIATAAYAFGRLVLDHGRMAELRAQESAFVVRLLRERFVDCAMVGRDLVRMLQDVAKIPAFRDLWQDLLSEPHRISAHFSGVDQLLRVPTPRMFLANRLTFDMEARLLFILEHVPTSSYARNLTWFVHRYLGTPESETLFSDIVRYVCGVCHPSNAVLASNIVQRYVFLGGLFRYIRSQVVAANVKLALFFDWLFYDARVDNIMNIEPGVLILARSVDKYAYLTASFVEFLSFVADAYCPPLAYDVRAGIAAAMRDAVEKGVVSSLAPVYEHPRVDQLTRRYMYQLFPQLVPPPPLSAAAALQTADPDDDENGDAGGKGEVGSADSAANGQPQFGGEADSTKRSVAPDVAKFVSIVPPKDIAKIIAALNSVHRASPTPTPTPTPTPALTSAGADAQQLGSIVDPKSLDPVSRMFHDEAAASNSDEQPANISRAEEDIDDSDEDAALLINGAAEDDELDVSVALKDPSLWLFGSTLSDFLDKMKDAADAPEDASLPQLGEAAKDIVNMFAQSEASVQAVATVLSHALGQLGFEDVETNAELEACGEGDSAEHDVMHYVFAAIAGYMPADASVGTGSGASVQPAAGWARCVDLLARLTRRAIDVGFRWLLYSIMDARRPHFYWLYVAQYNAVAAQPPPLRAALSRDMRTLQEQFPALFYTALPLVYEAFPGAVTGNRGIVRAVVAMIDQPQVHRLSVLLTQSKLRLFGARAAQVVGDTMDSADAFEQVCLWQLLAAEVSGDSATIDMLARGLLLARQLDPTANSEAASGLMAVLRSVRPRLPTFGVLLKYVGEVADDDDAAAARLNFCCCVLTTWMRADRAALFGLLPRLPRVDRERIVAWWKTHFGFEKYAAEIDEACEAKVTAAEAVVLAPASAPMPASAVLELTADEAHFDRYLYDDDNGNDGRSKGRLLADASSVQDQEDDEVIAGVLGIGSSESSVSGDTPAAEEQDAPVAAYGPVTEDVSVAESGRGTKRQRSPTLMHSLPPSKVEKTADKLVSKASKASKVEAADARRVTRSLRSNTKQTTAAPVAPAAKRGRRAKANKRPRRNVITSDDDDDDDNNENEDNDNDDKADAKENDAANRNDSEEEDESATGDNGFSTDSSLTSNSSPLVSSSEDDY